MNERERDNLFGTLTSRTGRIEGGVKLFFKSEVAGETAATAF